MCGIVLLFGPRAKERLNGCLGRLQHRGPDDCKTYHHGSMSLGFMRLAINDKSEAGGQPYFYNHYVSAINGEVFNFADLNEMLGYPCKSGNDCHVVAPLFNKLGGDLITQLDGFYSGLIYDSREIKLYTIRDYIGKKPLFIGRSGSEIFIVSELKAISLVDSFSALPLGICEVDLKTGCYSQLMAHSFSESALPSFRLDNSGCYRDLSSLLTQAVLKRLPSEDEPFGVFISGGLDSAVIAAIVAKHRSKAIYYCLADEGSKDYEYALKLIAHLQLSNIKFVKLPAKSEISELINTVVHTTQSYNPSIISNGICSYLLAQAANTDGVKVVLSGEGADELFGGYHESSTKNEWKTIREKLLEDMQFTELRRIDLACMAHSIECRCPFLDKTIFEYAKQLSYSDLYNDSLKINKYALRVAFMGVIPSEIIYRIKMSFDVGSGIRGLVVSALRVSGRGEKEALQIIWNSFFQSNFTDESLLACSYFHSYPVFDEVIKRRGVMHR